MTKDGNLKQGSTILTFFTRLPSPAVSLAVSSPTTSNSSRPLTQLEEHTSDIYKAKPLAVPSSTKCTSKLLSQEGRRKKKGFQKNNKHGLSEQAVQGREAARVAKRLKVQATSIATTALELPLPRQRTAVHTFAPGMIPRIHSLTNRQSRRGPVGYRKLKDFATLQRYVEAKEAVDSYKRKLKIARSGSLAFGPLDLILFQKKAEERFGTIMPKLLEDVPSSKGMLQYCKPVLHIIFAFCIKAFEEYEKTIASLIKRVRRLERLQTQSDKTTSEINLLTKGPDETYARTTLWTHAKAIEVSIRQHAGTCDIRAMTLAHEVVKMIGKPSTCKMETEVNATIVEAIRNLYDELKERHQGRYPKLIREAWSTMNTILGSVKGVPLCKVAQHIGVNVDRLYKGKGNWTKYLEDDDVNYLHDLNLALKDAHGNAWPKVYLPVSCDCFIHIQIFRLMPAQIHVYCKNRSGLSLSCTCG